MGRIYYGWFVVGVAMLAYLLLIGVINGAFGLFVVPVSEDFGLSRADTNSGLILLNIGASCLSPLIGRVLDRLPLKAVLVASALLAGGSIAALGLSRSLPLSAFVLMVPLAIGYGGAATLGLTVLIARWFDVHRARAIALGMIGMSLGGVVMPPLAGALIERVGWRATLEILGCGTAAVLALIFLIVRVRPRPDEVEPGAHAAVPGHATDGSTLGKPVTVLQILGAPQFWTVVVGFSLALGALQGIQVSIAPLALGAGFSLAQATTLMAALGGGAVAGALLVALFADRFDRVTLLALITLLSALLSAAPLLGHGYPVLLAVSVGAGFGSMALSPLFYAQLADEFGAASFGTALGLMAPIAGLLGAAGIRFAGEVFDRTGGYDLMFYVFVGVGVLAAALIFSTRFVSRPLAGQAGVAAAA